MQENEHACIVVLLWMRVEVWHGGEEILNKVIILVFFAPRKYSHKAS